MAEPLALRAWLLTRASVHESRVDELVRVLAAEWVHDVPTLLKTLHALERALPAAAFVALKEAADAEAQETPITDPPPPVQVPDEDDGPPPPYANTPPPLPLQGDHHLLRASREREREAAERQQALKAEVRRYRRVLRRARSCAIHPSSSWLRVWDVIAVAPCLMWTVAVTPFEVGFLSLAVDELWYANRAVDGLLLLDVALHFFVAYREPRDAKLITSLPLIASRYASSWLVVDVLSCVPLELGVRLLAASLLGLPPHEPLPSHAATFCRLAALVRALKLLRLTRLSRLIARWESPMTHLPYAAVRITANVAAVVVAVHWLACAWAYVTRVDPAPTALTASALTLGATPNSSIAGSYGSYEGLDAGWGPPPLAHLYGAALHTALAAVLGGPSEVGLAASLTPSQRVAHASLVVAGGLLWGYAVCACCALGPSLWPHLGIETQVAEELDEFCNERSLPHTLRDRLRGYFHSLAPLARAARHHILLERLSARLRGDTGFAMAAPLRRRVPYLRGDGFGGAIRIEADFLANVTLSLERSLHAPRDPIPATNLTLVERGLAARRGHLLGPGGCVGDDMIVTLNVFRDAAPAVALSYVQTAVLRRATLDALLQTGAYPHASRAVQVTAITLALRRAVVLVAARVRDGAKRAATTPGSPAVPAANHTDPYSYQLLSATPMRELLEEENANAATAAAAAALDADADVLSGMGQSGSAEAGAWQGELAACEARLAATVEAMRTQLEHALAPPAAAALPQPRRRVKRNVCQCSGGAPQPPTAPTLGCIPGHGLPTDHEMQQIEMQQMLQA